MEYKDKDFFGIIGMEGFSETLLKNHFKLYQGYVKNVNILNEKLSLLASEGKNNTPEYAELKRRFGWEFNGMRLHEYYFENLGGKDHLDSSSSLFKKIVSQFKDFETWKKDFTSTASLRGIGWAILYEDDRNGQLVNTWINEHDIGHLSGCRPLLVLDVFEHAFMTDYGLDRKSYIEAFFRNINWKVSSGRLK